MKKVKNIGIIGAGNMGSSLAAALKDSKRWRIYIYDKDPQKTLRLKGFCICNDAEEVIRKAEVIVLAIKPQDVEDFLKDNSPSLLQYKPFIITIAAGLSTRFFEKYLKRTAIVRVMPNLAAGVKLSVSFLCRGKFAKKKDLALAGEIFSFVGEVFVSKESFLDKVTAISGSGPGYLYYIMDGLYRSARKSGFKKDDAKRMVLLTVLGAAKLAQISGKDFDVLLKEVASPKGTTEAAVGVFRKKRLAEIIDKGVNAAYIRAKEISRKYLKVD